MQKKLIALAIAGLASAPVFAQSSVQIYGVVDMGYQHHDDSDALGLSDRNGLDSGIQSGSRIGFRGTEDLGNGLKVSFVLENSIGVDVGSGPSMTRQSFLALSGNFGTVAAGRQYSPQYNLLASLDPFGVGTAGDVLYGRGTYFMGTIAGNVTRLDNLIAYVSPEMYGFTVTAGFSANAIGDETDDADADARIWAISPVYKNGPVMVGLNYHQVDINDFAGSDFKNRVWDIGGTYDFGMAKIAAVYGQNKGESHPDFGDAKAKQWMVGATIPVSAVGNVLVSYARTELDADLDAVDGARASKWALGYTHDLSKRTNLYAAYAKLSTNSDAEGLFSVRSAGSFDPLDLAGDDYTTGFNIGIRHKF